MWAELKRVKNLHTSLAIELAVRTWLYVQGHSTNSGPFTSLWAPPQGYWFEYLFGPSSREGPACSVPFVPLVLHPFLFGTVLRKIALDPITLWHQLSIHNGHIVAVDAAVIYFSPEKRNTSVKTWYRQHNQYQPGRGCLISLFFFCCFESSQVNWHPHISGKRQYHCILFRKSLVDIHSCLTEWQKYPWSLKLLV